MEARYIKMTNEDSLDDDHTMVIKLWMQYVDARIDERVSSRVGKPDEQAALRVSAVKRELEAKLGFPANTFDMD